MENYEDMKNQVEEFKKKVLEYFEENKHDVTIYQLFRDLNLEISDLNLLEYILNQLVEEKILRKEFSMNTVEYDLVEEEII